MAHRRPRFSYRLQLPALSAACVAAAAGALCIGGPAQSQTADQKHPVRDTSSTTTDAALFAPARALDRADDALVLRIDESKRAMLAAAEGAISVRLPLGDGDEVSLALERFNVLSHDARLIVMNEKGEESTHRRPDVVLLRGRIEGEWGSHACIAFDSKGGGLGVISRANGERFSLGSVRLDDNGVGIAVRPGMGDLPDFAEFCGMFQVDPNQLTQDAEPLGPGGGDQAGPLDYRGLRLLRIAVDADQEYSELFDSPFDSVEYITMLIGAVSDVYMRDLGFRMELAFARTWPFGGEPFGADDLSGFRDYWQNNEDMEGLNLIHLFSGRRNLSYGGVAYLASACSDSAFGISGYLIGAFPDHPENGHLGNWDIVVVAHEMGHNMGTGHTHGYNPPVDFCTSNEVTYGTIMSYCHTLGGGLMNTDLRFHRRVQDFVRGNNPHGGCIVFDCNANGIDDAVDIANGDAVDSNANGVPDSCEDCNGNGVLDPIDIANGDDTDINFNGIPDGCEDDCNGNGLPDLYDIATLISLDVNGNNTPDECEPDCNGNGVIDWMDFHNGTAEDVNRNRRPDECDDCNENGVVDWLDTERAHHLFLSSAFSAGDNTSIREYHAESGVLVDVHAIGAIADGVDLEFGDDRQLYVASYSNGRIVRVNVDNDSTSTFVEAGTGGLQTPGGLAFGPDGHLYVADNTGDAIRAYDGTTGASLGDFVSPGGGGLDAPWNLKFGPDGHLYVACSPDRVLRFDGTTGAPLGEFASAGLDDPRGLAFLPDGDLLVTSMGGPVLQRFAADGTPLGQFNVGGYPIGSQWMIEVGLRGNVFVARQSTPVRIVELDTQRGIYERSFVRGDNDLIGPVAAAFRPSSSNDSNNDFIPDDCQCAADIDGSGVVGVDDLLLLLASWGDCEGCPADFDQSGAVDVNDLLALLAAWGDC